MAVSFEFNYIEPQSPHAGSGFFDLSHGSKFRDALQTSADELGELFLHDATVVLDVYSILDDSPGASARSEWAATSVGFHHGVVAQKILSDGTIDSNGTESDGQITIRFPRTQKDPSSQVIPSDLSPTFVVGDLIHTSNADSRYSFDEVVTHEMLHTLGFSSATKDARGLGGLNSVPGKPDAWLPFDRYVGDFEGNPIVDPETFALNGDVYVDHVTGGESLEPLETDDGKKNHGLFFHGPNAIAASYYGQPVALYSPLQYAVGSSTSHLDSTSVVFNDVERAGQRAIMTHAQSPGPLIELARIAGSLLRHVEAGILLDLGYSMVPKVRLNIRPTISDIPDQTLKNTEILGPITFVIGDAETPADQLQVSVNSGSHDIIPQSGLKISGSGASRTLTITPLPNRSGILKISVSVMDAGNLSTVTTFSLTVTGEDTRSGLVVSPEGARQPGIDKGEVDPPDLPSGPQPTSWLKQRSEVRTLLIKLENAIKSVSASDFTMSRIRDRFTIPRQVVITDSQLHLSEDGHELRIFFDKLDTGAYYLNIVTAIPGVGLTENGQPDPNNGFDVLTGDFTGDGIVSTDDFPTLAYWYGRAIPQAPRYVDLDGNGVVDLGDYEVLRRSLGTSTDHYQSVVGEQTSEAEIAEMQTKTDVLHRSLFKPTDANGDGAVSAQDALRIINQLQFGVETEVVHWSPLDVDRNGRITALDALLVINDIGIERVTVIPTPISSPPIVVIPREIKLPLTEYVSTLWVRSLKPYEVSAPQQTVVDQAIESLASEPSPNRDLDRRLSKQLLGDLAARTRLGE